MINQVSSSWQTLESWQTASYGHCVPNINLELSHNTFLVSPVVLTVMPIYLNTRPWSFWKYTTHISGQCSLLLYVLLHLCDSKSSYVMKKQKTCSVETKPIHKTNGKEILNSPPITKYPGSFSFCVHSVSLTSLLNPFTSPLNLITPPSLVFLTVTWFVFSVSGTTAPFTLTSPVASFTAFLTYTWYDQKIGWTVHYDSTSPGELFKIRKRQW